MLMASLKQKGDLAELKIAADLIARGCRPAISFGEDCDHDLIADFEGHLHRIQVKFTQSNGRRIRIRCRSHSLTKGKVRQTKHFTASMVDWIAVYDHASDRCYYCPSRELGSGRGRSGASRIRTGDIVLAKHALCQLSYGPVSQIVGPTALPGEPDHQLRVVARIDFDRKLGARLELADQGGGDDLGVGDAV